VEEKVKLGYKVKDLISGFEGIVEHLAFYANQGTMAAVQSSVLDKDGKRIEGEGFDITQLEVLDTKPPFVIPEPPEQLFQFGDKVKCKFTDYAGTVTGRAIYINGCSRLYVQPRYNSGAQMKSAEGKFIPEGSLELVESAKPKDVPAKTTRGGPSPADSSREW
jgi:hypothetical protein